MDLEYLKEHIEEELCGAKDYIKRAIEIKPMDATWSKTLVEMSANELTHATHLYNMANQYVNSIMKETYQELPDYISDTWEEIVDNYMECSAMVKHMHEMYK